MKGIELPVNALIVIVLAIAVFVGIIAFFMGVWGPSTTGVNLESVKNTACQKFVSLGYCGDSTKDGSSITTDAVTCFEQADLDDLKEIAINCYGVADAQELCC